MAQVFAFKEIGLNPFPVQRWDWLKKCSDEICEAEKIWKAQTSHLQNGVSKHSSLNIYKIIKNRLDINIGPGSQKYEKEKMDVAYSLAYNFIFSYNWNLYKQIYKFDDDLFELLTENTDTANVPVDIIKANLPYPAFFIDNKIQGTNGTIYRGVYVSLIYNSNNQLELGVFFVEDNEESDYLFCFVPLEMGIQTLKELMSIRDIKMNLQGKEESREMVIDITNRILNVIIYICSANKEVERVKVNIQDNPETHKGKSKKKKNQSKRTAVVKSFVGYKLGETIRKNKNKKTYQYIPSEGNGRGVRKSAHLRRAHYHSFWIGKRNNPEDRQLIVKFIPPIYVNSESDDIISTVHKVKE